MGYETNLDDVALFSESHPSVVPGQATQSNLGTAAVFNHDNLEVGTQNLEEQVTDDGNPLSLLGKPVLVIPPALRKEGFEITESELDPSTANSAINFYKNGIGLDMVVSTYLSSNNSIGGSNTAFFLTVPQRAGLTHVVRKEPTMAQDVDIKSGIATFTVSARWADCVKDFRRTWGNQGA
mgnify:CR=1 FL=1